MKKLLILFLPILFFSCAPKTTKEQNEAYNSCKKIILDNQKLFLENAATKEKEDSLKQYVEDLQKCNLDQLINKYDVDPAEVNVLVYSVCTKAEGVKSLKIIENEILRTDSVLKALDSKTLLDSLHLPSENK
ncbi:MAG: hypothetical protein NT084_04485 [Bacteroidetes bacterium]|jgi:hypothetical protein|nr:hypothetical protein [Bacteroidota bacterium]